MPCCLRGSSLRRTVSIFTTSAPKGAPDLLAHGPSTAVPWCKASAELAFASRKRPGTSASLAECHQAPATHAACPESYCKLHVCLERLGKWRKGGHYQLLKGSQGIRLQPARSCSSYHASSNEVYRLRCLWSAQRPLLPSCPSHPG